MSTGCFQIEHCIVVLYNKHVLDKQLSRFLCFNFMHCVQKKSNLFLARLSEISVNSNENYRRCNFPAFANISRKFPANLQPYLMSPGSD